MKTDLTEEELGKIEITRNKWIDLAYKKCGEGINEEKFNKGIEWVYGNLLNLKKPQIIYCDSLINALIKITMVKDFDLDFEADPSLFETKMKEYNSDLLPKDFADALKENLSLKYSYIGWSNFGWVSFYDYFSEIGVLDNEAFNQYRNLIESNVFEAFEFENTVFAVQPPTSIISTNDLPHCTTGPAITMRDGSEYYYINGLLVKEKLFKSLVDGTYNFQDFLNEENEEIKSAVLFYLEDVYGTEGVFDFISNNLSEVDVFVNEKSSVASDIAKVYTLYKGEVSGYDIAYVKCACPSTERKFFLGVQPEETNAKDAIASLYRIPTQLKDKIVSFSRQGEKFSTIFDQETTTKIANSEFGEFEDYTSLTGDEYFSLIENEF